MQLPLCNLSLFFSTATCYGFLGRHQLMYTIITKIIEPYTESVVLELLFVLLPAMPTKRTNKEQNVDLKQRIRCTVR
jgi:hypothetical protein